jgi:hypothetical protein
MYMHMCMHYWYSELATMSYYCVFIWFTYIIWLPIHVDRYAYNNAVFVYVCVTFLHIEESSLGCRY